MESDPDAGSTFAVFLPVSDKKIQAIQKTAEPSIKKQQVVLIIDDDLGVSSVLKEIFDAQNYEVILADGGQSGLAAFNTNSSRIDLIVLDMTMPDMNGTEVFHAIRKQNTTVSILLSSGQNEQDATELLSGDNHVSFQQKPFRMPTLLAQVKKLAASTTDAKQ